MPELRKKIRATGKKKEKSGHVFFFSSLLEFWEKNQNSEEKNLNSEKKSEFWEKKSEF